LDGSGPLAPLTTDSRGNFYGTTEYGSVAELGTVFKLEASGKETVLYSFQDNGKDGWFPLGGVVRDKDGNLYGTTSTGGVGACYGSGCGTIFKVDEFGNETVLYSFTGGADGGNPRAGLIRDSEGNLYGTTYYGGDLTCNTLGCGVVFKLDRAGKESVLHTFKGNPDGANPSAGLIRDRSGNLYGVAGQGGAFGSGTVFEIIH
jgi:uncharacterized repeat protein (TIGR03803 family)